MIVRVFLQTVVLAFGQIWANKTRAALTALGIIIGVSSVTAVIAALTGMRTFILDEFETFGANKVFMDGRVPRDLRGQIPWLTVQLQEEEIHAILEHCPTVDMLTPIYFGAYEVRHGEEVLTSVQTQGIWPEWHEIEQRFVISGRTFNKIDEAEARSVCLINEKAIEELNLDKDPVNQFINIKERRFQIVGIVETKDVSAMFGGGDTNSEIYIPLSMARKLNPWGWINYAVGTIHNPEESDEAIAQIKNVLRTKRGIRGDDPETFEVQVLQTFIDQFNGIAAGITAMAGGVVSISLLVGGIGIMNIMLVSVSERTREIGLRKAVGARPGIVLMQFLVEAVVLCVVGGVIGLDLGMLMTFGIQNIPDANLESAHIPSWAVALAFVFSAGTGVIFGMFPAIKAARLDPIEALRHE
ncbi:MAG: ABC transporter permease [Phycisphaerales bacterium JB043]